MVCSSYLAAGKILLALSLLTILAAACGTQETDSSPSTSVSTPAEPTHTPGPTSAATPGVAELDVKIAADTTWKDIFGSFTDENQSCIRDQFGDDLESVLAQRLFDDERETLIVECLGPDMSRAIYLSHSVKYLENMSGLGELSTAEISCLSERATSLDIVALSADDAADDAEFFAGAISCAPDSLISGMTTELGMNLEDLTRQETSCLRRFLVGLDAEALAGLDDDGGPPPEVISGVFSCLPDILISEFIGRVGLTMDDLSREEQSCLRDRVTDIDWSDDPDDAELGLLVLSCIPDVLISDYIDGLGLTMDDLSREELSCLRNRVTNIDWSDDPGEAELGLGMLSCIPDVLISDHIDGLGLTMDDLSREEQSCLRDWATDIDWSDDPDDAELKFGVLSCIPDVLISYFISGFGMSMEDLSRREQSCLGGKD